MPWSSKSLTGLPWVLYNHFMQNIPKSSEAFFQEYRFETLNGVKHAELIMERLLAYGDRVEVRWLFDNYGAENIRHWVQWNGERLLPRRRYELWRVLFDLPGVQKSERLQVWPY
jgi:Family of unknown function (DUF6922)